METIAIGDVCEVLNGYAFKSEKYTSSGIRIIRIANVQKGYIEDNSPVFYPIDWIGYTHEIRYIRINLLINKYIWQ